MAMKRSYQTRRWLSWYITRFVHALIAEIQKNAHQGLM